jgi:hypothetical protein
MVLRVSGHPKCVVLPAFPLSRRRGREGGAAAEQPTIFLLHTAISAEERGSRTCGLGDDRNMRQLSALALEGLQRLYLHMVLGTQRISTAPRTTPDSRQPPARRNGPTAANEWRREGALAWMWVQVGLMIVVRDVSTLRF